MESEAEAEAQGTSEPEGGAWGIAKEEAPGRQSRPEGVTASVFSWPHATASVFSWPHATL
eukprot:1197015-Rhodomonas_salina.4